MEKEKEISNVKFNNVSFYKAGTGTGARIILSVPLLKKMGITQESKAVVVTYEEDKIVIKKS